MTNDIICIILARKGSKRLPNKHLANINGVTLIRRAINKVIKADLFDDIILSTDCADCMQEARDAGISIIERDSELCMDESCLINAFMDAVDKSVEMYGKRYRWGCLFQPTHFLVSTDLLKRMYNIISSVRGDNPRASDSFWGAVTSWSHLYPWCFDLRPGASALPQKELDYFDTKSEISIDIDKEEDLERARLLHKYYG